MTSAKISWRSGLESQSMCVSSRVNVLFIIDFCFIFTEVHRHASGGCKFPCSAERVRSAVAVGRSHCHLCLNHFHHRVLDYLTAVGTSDSKIWTWISRGSSAYFIVVHTYAMLSRHSRGDSCWKWQGHSSGRRALLRFIVFLMQCSYGGKSSFTHIFLSTGINDHSPTWLEWYFLQCRFCTTSLSLQQRQCWPQSSVGRWLLRCPYCGSSGQRERFIFSRQWLSISKISSSKRQRCGLTPHHSQPHYHLKLVLSSSPRPGPLVRSITTTNIYPEK